MISIINKAISKPTKAHQKVSLLLLQPCISEMLLCSVMVGDDETISLVLPFLCVVISLSCVIMMLVVVVGISIEDLSLALMLSVVGGVSGEHSV